MSSKIKEGDPRVSGAEIGVTDSALGFGGSGPYSSAGQSIALCYALG